VDEFNHPTMEKKTPRAILGTWYEIKMTRGEFRHSTSNKNDKWQV